MFTVDQRMNRFVLTITLTQSLEQAAQAMIERRVGSAMVMSGATFVGIVTERDLLRAVAHGTVPWTTKVEEVMTAEPVCATPDIEITEATRMMVEGGFRHLPVVDSGKLVGMISLRDLLVATQEAQAQAS